MPALRDRVKDTSTSTGTGALTLSGVAPTGYQTFANALAIGQPFTYCIVGGAQWETGTGWLTTATTMARDPAVFDGSSGPGVLVNFSAGTKDVFVDAPAHFLEDLDTGATLHRITGMAMP